MSADSFKIEVQPDFLERQAKARPIQAVAELIWNGLDADATEIGITLRRGTFGIASISIHDNGVGIPHSEAPALFSSLGGSWKKPGGRTQQLNRILHGYEGRGRFKAFALGRVVDWHVTYIDADSATRSYDLSMLESNLKEVRRSAEKSANGHTGVEVVVSELRHEFRSLDGPDAQQELAETFALYLKDYRDVRIVYDGAPIAPEAAIASSKRLELDDLVDEDGTHHRSELEIVEWRSSTHRALYLCNEQGFPLTRVPSRFHVGEFQFSAYLKSSYIAALHAEGTLDLGEMDPALSGAIQQAQETIKEHFQDRAAEQARAVVDEWKAEEIYPFKSDAKTSIEEAERQVFDIVAVRINNYLPEFASSPPKSKAFHLRMLRQAIERSPQELQIILNEVLDLPPRKQQELADLLQETTLSAVISAAKIVADRLKFLTGLEAIVFDPEMKKRLKERTQLHRILADNAWIFGEEFNLSVDDQSLTAVLKKHKKLLGEDVVIDRPVKHVEKARGIVDLVFSRAIRSHGARLEHLVVELKAPQVVIRRKEVAQIEDYARSVSADERFRSLKVRWEFWVLSDDYDDTTAMRLRSLKRDDGIFHEEEGFKIGVKRWSQVIEENRARLQFFQEKLEHQADRGRALKHLQEKYEKFLKGVITDGPEEEADGEKHASSTESATDHANS